MLGPADKGAAAAKRWRVLLQGKARRVKLGMSRPTVVAVTRHSRPLSAALFFVALMLVFLALSPSVFLNPRVYVAVFQSLPITIFLALPLIFLIAAGEIDLSFPSVIGLGAWVFALAVQGGWGPYVGLTMAIVVGAMAGWLNGILVARFGLSSLVATLGMNFLLRGFILLQTQGNLISVNQVEGTVLYDVFAGSIAGFPAQMIWGVVFVLFCWILFRRHAFGAQACCVGDNAMSAVEMGIDIRSIKTLCFIFVGAAAGLAGVLSVLINFTFYPTTGDGYLLSTLAAVFIGGTPVWGGVASVVGAVFGSLTVSFIAIGIVAAGFTGFYIQFFDGLVVILAMIGHRFNQARLQ
jgi:ribose/xylose/arabinose/galactoside ABC-type transport system permease subunit